MKKTYQQNNLLLILSIPQSIDWEEKYQSPEMIKNKLTFYISKTVHIESILSVIPEEKKLISTS